eukprot:TRINITY_DN867_c0_g1_i1.p5 TRINITY_DN867_c0_g1~~TRINITY_DN867_c0_g1_i1.p5  ORF type:complete len:104 (-),score=13.97 TRINITY_DN867_c0_g1_i1:1284-1595(-)
MHRSNIRHRQFAMHTMTADATPVACAATESLSPWRALTIRHRQHHATRPPAAAITAATTVAKMQTPPRTASPPHRHLLLHCITADRRRCHLAQSPLATLPSSR